MCGSTTTRTPRRHSVGDSYLIPDADGRYQLPEMDAEGDRQQAHHETRHRE